MEAGSKLVQEAGATMDKVVESVRKVTTIVADISLASQEQSTGIAEVGSAVTLMDQAPSKTLPWWKKPPPPRNRCNTRRWRWQKP